MRGRSGRRRSRRRRRQRRRCGRRMKNRDKRRTRSKEEEHWERERGGGAKIDAFVFSCRVDTMGKRKETKNVPRSQIERRQRIIVRLRLLKGWDGFLTENCGCQKY